MSYLVVLVLDNPDRCDQVLEAWEAAGTRGVTILESTGIGRMRRAGIRDDIPLMPSISELFRSKETHHRTLFSVVETEEQGERLIEATEEVIGDLDLPNTGLTFIVRLVTAKGMAKQ